MDTPVEYLPPSKRCRPASARESASGLRVGALSTSELIAHPCCAPEWKGRRGQRWQPPTARLWVGRPGPLQL